MTRSRIPGVTYCINPYRGCEHGCRYCYADFMCRFREPQEPWGSFLDAKVNAPELLKRELKTAKPGSILLSSVTDPYQPVEGKYELTKRCLQVLRFHKFPVEILTKSVMVTRDVDLLTQFDDLRVGMTVTTDDEAVQKLFEPNSPPTTRRVETLRKLKAMGIKTYAFVGPALPMDPERLGRMLVGTVDFVYFDRMNYRWKVEGIYRKYGLQDFLNPNYFHRVQSTIVTIIKNQGVEYQVRG